MHILLYTQAQTVTETCTENEKERGRDGQVEIERKSE